MSERVVLALSARPGRARVITPGNIAVVRVPVAARGFRTTVTAGLDAFSQVVSPALCEMPQSMVSGAVEAIRRLLPERAERINSEVQRRVDDLVSDPEAVRAVREAAAQRREKQFKLDRENLVATMSDLLASGWTHQMLLDAVSSATCANVMSA